MSPSKPALSRGIAASLLAAVTWCAGGCYSPVNVSHAESGLLAGGAFIVVRGIDLPRVTGVKGCGAQALAASIAFVDDSVDAEALAVELPWHEVGATPVDLLLAARKRGLQATIMRGSWEELTRRVEADQPVLVMIDAGYEVRGIFSRHELPRVMHWSVVSGMAADGATVLLAAEGSRHHKVRREDFQRRWARSDNCAIVIEAGDPGDPSVH